VVFQIADELAEPVSPLKIWLDTGTHEEGWERTAQLRDRLADKGWRLHGDLQYIEEHGGQHTEEAWATRFEAVLRFLFPASHAGRAKPADPKIIRPKLIVPELAL
jgi:hypothetical protein